MRRCATHFIRPGVELDVRVQGKGARRTDVTVPHQGSRQLRQTLVDPGLLVAVVVPVDHVLELVSQNTLVVPRARPVDVHIDVEHLPLIAVGVNLTSVLVCAGIVATHVRDRGIEDVQVRIAIHTRAPLLAEVAAQGRVDVTLELLG